MYSKQLCSVKWDNEQSDYLNISKVHEQGGVVSLLLFSCYVGYVTQLHHSGLGCHVACWYTAR